MKYILALLVSFALLVSSISAQTPTGEGGSTYSGTVVGSSDTTDDGENDTFDIDLDGDGNSDVTIEADGIDGTELVADGLAVKFKLKKKRKRDEETVREVSEWVELGSSGSSVG